MRGSPDVDPARRPFAVMFVVAVAITAIADVAALRGGHAPDAAAAPPLVERVCRAQAAAGRGDGDGAAAAFRRAEPGLHRLSGSGAASVDRADQAVERDLRAREPDTLKDDLDTLAATVASALSAPRCASGR